MATYYGKDCRIDWRPFTEAFFEQPGIYHGTSTASRDPRPLNEYTAEEFAELERRAAKLDLSGSYGKPHGADETDTQRANRLLSEVASKYDPQSS